MASHPFPHVAGFAVAGDAERPIVCVCVQEGDEPGIWIGRAWPGGETYVIAEPVHLRPATIDDVRLMLEAWPQTKGNVGNALQQAAVRGRSELIDAKMRAGLKTGSDLHLA